MNLQEYREESAKTAIYPNVGSNWVYPLMGLIGEIGEFATAKTIRDREKEASDICWFCAALSRELDIEFSLHSSELWTWNGIGIHDEMLLIASTIAENAQKVIRDHGYAFPETRKTVVEQGISKILRLIDLSLEVDIEVILDLNMKKLLDRQSRGVLGGDGDNR